MQIANLFAHTQISIYAMKESSDDEDDDDDDDGSGDTK